MNFKTFLIVITLFPISIHQLSATPADDAKLVAANNGFAFKLLQQLVNDQPGSNIFISPYSASTVSQMVGIGASGQTKKEMDQVLGTAGMSADAVGLANKNIAQSLNNLQTNVNLTTANAVWYRRDAEVKPDFLARNQKLFGATIAPLDFADPGCVNVINSWSSDKTRGKIPRVANGMIDPRQTALFLANAVYFKGKWADPFDVKNTKDRAFNLRGKQKSIPTMTKSGTFTYRRGTGYQAVRLPYQGFNLAMYVFLPNTNSSPKKLLGIMSGDVWKRTIRPGFRAEKGTIGLPKFKLEYGVELKQPLRAMGMKAAFDRFGNADFSGIAPNLFISAVRQKTFVEVNEEGTEAAAVTGIAVEGFSLPPPDRFQMIVDRPFLFFIEDTRTGAILFMGAIFDPSAS